jgi:hypothetical protein
MLAASSSTLFIREVEELSIDPNWTPYANPMQIEQYDDVLEYSAQVGLAGLGVAAAGLIVNVAVHAYQRRRIDRI